MNKIILNKKFQEKKLDVIFSMAPQTRLWYSKVNTSDGWLFIEPKGGELIVDGRYIEYAMKESNNVKVHLFGKDTFKNLAIDKKYKRIGIEEEYITLSQQKFIQKLFPKAKLIAIKGQELRIIKSKEEVKLIAKAAKISIKALKKVEHMIKPGIKESEIDRQLNFELKALGADKESFDSIIASGYRGSLPHGRASNKKLKSGELVTIDFGVVYKGYVSDVTRTFAIGEIKNKKLIKIQRILRKAQMMGILAVKPGVETFEIDKICRDYITKKGYGKYFVHSTGHGVGIDVHELPSVSASKKNSIKLEAGMIITVEPGIYIKGLGGIRLEDDILVTKTGHKILSR